MKNTNKIKMMPEGKKDSLQKKSYFWNMSSGVLNSLQSVIWLMIITRIMGIKEAGIFTIAYAVANLMLTFGKFGMRNFQVSDSKDAYNFHTYVISRIISTLLMGVVSFIYIYIMYIFQLYSAYKMQVVILMCILKSLDSIEDVFYAMYQQKGRLDIAGEIMSIRLFLTIIIFIIGLIVTKNLVLTLVGSIIFSSLILLIGLKFTIKKFNYTNNIVWNVEIRNSFLLLYECVPLCLCGFFSFFICNIPKYTIDIFLGEEEQAYFAFISMPIFVISLLGNIIFQPILLKLSISWQKNEKKSFILLISKELTIITIVSLIVVLVASLIGIPLLDLLYATSLIKYRTDFIILMIGGLFLSLSTFLCTVLTVIRLQKYLMYIYAILSFIAIVITPLLVRARGLRGASMVYMLLELGTSVMFCIRLVIEIKRKEKCR